MLTEVPFMEKSLLGGLGPNFTKPFWGQGLNLLGTGMCVGPLMLVLHCPGYGALPVGQAV